LTLRDNSKKILKRGQRVFRVIAWQKIKIHIINSTAHTEKNPEKKSVLFSKMRIFFSQNDHSFLSNRRIIRRFEKKNDHFEKKSSFSRKVQIFFSLFFAVQRKGSANKGHIVYLILVMPRLINLFKTVLKMKINIFNKPLKWQYPFFWNIDKYWSSNRHLRFLQLKYVPYFWICTGWHKKEAWILLFSSISSPFV